MVNVKAPIGYKVHMNVDEDGLISPLTIQRVTCMTPTALPTCWMVMSQPSMPIVPMVVKTMIAD